MKKYSSNKNGNFGIQKDISLIDFKTPIYTIWEDPFCEDDFLQIDDLERFPDLPSEFKTEKEAMDYLENKFGKLKK